MTALASPRTETAPPAARRGLAHLLVPIGVLVLAALAAAATYRTFIGTTLGQTVDSVAMRGGDVQHPRVEEVLSRTLNGTTLVSLVLVCLVAAAVGVLRKRIDLALGAGLLVLGANAGTQLLKMNLPRPDLDGTSMPNSFPSGHTAAAASVAFALVLVLPQAIRGTVALVGASYVAIIAIATVWAEWHRPSDTVAALCIVLAWGSLAAFGIRLRIRLRPVEPRRPNRWTTLALLLSGAVSAAVFLLGLGAVVLSETVTPDLVSGRFAFLTGTAGIAAAVAGVFMLWVRLASDPRPPTAEPPAASEEPESEPQGVPS